MNEGGYSGDDNAEFQSTAIGLVLICWSLVMDGATAGTQKRLQRQMASNPPTTYDFLVFTNFSMLVFGLAISHWTGDLEHGRAFLTENPDCWTMLMRCCLCSAVGQSFIFYVISVFDPLVLSTVTTTRKIFSVLLSIGFKGHSLTNRGFCGLAMALAGLCIEIEGKVNAKRPAPQQRPGVSGPKRFPKAAITTMTVLRIRTSGDGWRACHVIYSGQKKAERNAQSSRQKYHTYRTIVLFGALRVRNTSGSITGTESPQRYILNNQYKHIIFSYTHQSNKFVPVHKAAVERETIGSARAPMHTCFRAQATRRKHAVREGSILKYCHNPRYIRHDLRLSRTLEFI